MTQPESAPAASCDALLRQARELLDNGELAPASAAGWQVAVRAMATYAGPDADFTDAARRLVKGEQGRSSAAEWMTSAMALSDNIQYDWLDKEGIARRLDDVQRLVILITDLSDPPQSADDILRRARECLDNGALPVASEKGWEAALCATKIYADAMGYEHRGDSHFDDVTRMLTKEDARGRQVSKGTSAALTLHQAAAYCTVYPHWLHPEFVAEDINAIAELASIVQELAAAGNRTSGENV